MKKNGVTVKNQGKSGHSFCPHEVKHWSQMQFRIHSNYLLCFNTLDRNWKGKACTHRCRRIQDSSLSGTCLRILFRKTEIGFSARVSN